jgi:hypothetical protein
MPILNGKPYSSAQLLDLLGEFPQAFEDMAKRGLPFCPPEQPTPEDEVILKSVKGDRFRPVWAENRIGRLYPKPAFFVIHRRLLRDVEFVCLNSMELVVAGCLADDQDFVDSYLSGEDLHQRRANLMGVTVEEAKLVNYNSIVFGDAAHGSTGWPELCAARERLVAQAVKDNLVRTLFFRKAFINPRGKAWSHYVLGTTADLIKMGLVLASRANIPVYGTLMDEFVVEPGYSEAMSDILSNQLPVKFLVSGPPRNALSRICGDDVI